VRVSYIHILTLNDNYLVNIKNSVCMLKLIYGIQIYTP